MVASEAVIDGILQIIISHSGPFPVWTVLCICTIQKTHPWINNNFRTIKYIQWSHSKAFLGIQIYCIIPWTIKHRMIGLSPHLFILSDWKCFLSKLHKEDKQQLLILQTSCAFCFHMWLDVPWASLFRQLISSFLSLIYNQQLANIKCRGFQFVFTSMKSKCEVLLEQNITLCLKVNNYPDNQTFESQSLNLAWLGQISENNF